jgi:hypothetical protein
MDWLIKMEIARSNIDRAIAELDGVEGLEYLVEQLFKSWSELSKEITEYKSHSELDS